jgi:probable lipoprotein NlpC
MSWWADYIGIPFADHGRDESGCDCWGLARLVYRREQGIELPSYTDVYDSVKDGVGLSGNWEAVKHAWRKIETPIEFAIPLFRFHSGLLHVGVMIDAERMLHVEAGKMACVEKVAPWRNLLQGYYVPAV